MIVVCPNHHKMFDRGAITIDLSSQRVIHVNPKHEIHHRPLYLKENHTINPKYVSYYNNQIYLGRSNVISNSKPKMLSRSRSIPVKPVLETTSEGVDYSDIVELIDTSSGELFQVKIEPSYQREFMTVMQKALLGKITGKKFHLNGFDYMVTKITKRE